MIFDFDDLIPGDQFPYRMAMAINGHSPTNIDMNNLIEPGPLAQAGSDPNIARQFGNRELAGQYPGLLGNVADDYTDVANYQEKYGPENVYASDIGTQGRLLLSKMGLMDAPVPLTIEEQEAQKIKDADMAAQMKAAEAANKSFKAAVKAGTPEEEEKMKMLSPMFRAAANARPIAAPGGLNPYGGFRSLYPSRRA